MWPSFSYFAWDRGSTFLSLLSLLPTLLRAPRKSSNLAIIAIAVAQYFQHTYYIRGWDAKAPHVKEIVEWSAVATNGERVKKFGWERHMGHYLATGFDMSVHGMMVLLQLAWLGEN